jgi:hypothetical protein
MYRLLRGILSPEVEMVNKIKEWAATEMSKQIYARHKVKKEDSMEIE